MIIIIIPLKKAILMIDLTRPIICDDYPHHHYHYYIITTTVIMYYCRHNTPNTAIQLFSTGRRAHVRGGLVCSSS